MKGHIVHIQEATRANTDYRRVLYTTPHLQLVLMRIMPGDAIGEETHELAQFIRFEEGEGVVVIDGVTHTVSGGWAVVIPAGALHNVMNTGTVPLTLYSIYAPPEHKEGTVHLTKADEKEEHFDGATSE
jgi:mannose-6-phosphate isomerase-like protein (cupin superfamily)